MNTTPDQHRRWTHVALVLALTGLAVAFTVRSYLKQDDVQLGLGSRAVYLHLCRGVVAVSCRYEQGWKAEGFDWRTTRTDAYRLSEECRNHIWGFGVDARRIGYRDGRVAWRRVAMMPMWALGVIGVLAVLGVSFLVGKLR